MSCPATEVFYGGAAGGGKSDYLLGDWYEHCSKYGKYASGILFRQSNSELEELQKRADELFTQLGGRYTGSSKRLPNTWVFKNGATLKMRYLESEDDVRRYQGHQYTWIGIDELGNYPTPYCWSKISTIVLSVSDLQLPGVRIVLQCPRNGIMPRRF